MRWSWSAVRSLPKRLLFLGLASGLLGGLFGALSIAQGGGLFVGLGVLQLSMPVLMLLWLLNVGLSKGEIKTKTTPNEGIHRSARIALGSGLLAGMVGGLLFGLVGELGIGPVFDLGGGRIFGPGGGLYFGLALGLDYGGRACLQHLALRLLLVRNGSAPWHYVDFLDYATERIFLRKVGGGYMFIHRLLQDYFAARHTEPSDGTS